MLFWSGQPCGTYFWTTIRIGTNMPIYQLAYENPLPAEILQFSCTFPNPCRTDSTIKKLTCSTSIFPFNITNPYISMKSQNKGSIYAQEKKEILHILHVCLEILYKCFSVCWERAWGMGAGRHVPFIHRRWRSEPKLSIVVYMICKLRIPSKSVKVKSPLGRNRYDWTWN